MVQGARSPVSNPLFAISKLSKFCGVQEGRPVVVVDVPPVLVVVVDVVAGSVVIGVVVGPMEVVSDWLPVVVVATCEEQGLPGNLAMTS